MTMHVSTQPLHRRWHGERGGHSRCNMQGSAAARAGDCATCARASHMQSVWGGGAGPPVLVGCRRAAAIAGGWQGAPPFLRGLRDLQKGGLAEERGLAYSQAWLAAGEATVLGSYAHALDTHWHHRLGAANWGSRRGFTASEGSLRTQNSERKGAPRLHAHALRAVAGASCTGSPAVGEAGDNLVLRRR